MRKVCKYGSKEINANFRVKIYFPDRGLDTLVGFSGLSRLVSDSLLLDRILDRAFSCRADKCVVRLRRGLQIAFYFK